MKALSIACLLVAASSSWASHSSAASSSSSSAAVTFANAASVSEKKGGSQRKKSSNGANTSGGGSKPGSSADAETKNHGAVVGNKKQSKSSSSLNAKIDGLLESTHYAVDPTTGRGPWNKIVVIGDIHGDLDQGLVLLKESGVVSHQPDYYANMILEQARSGKGSGAYGGSASSGSNKNNAELQQKIDDGLGDFLPKDIAANMISNKRGDLMSGQTVDEFHWAIGKTLVVILGDSMNVGPDDIAAVTLIRRLTREADLAGGKLVHVLGNHEVMNLRGDFSGVHPWSLERTGGAEGRRNLLSTGTEIGRFLRSRPGLFYYDNLMFMHGGLMPATINMVEREAAEESNTARRALTGGELANTINRHVREALFTNEDDVEAMDKDPIAASVVNVNYDENGKNGILLVHPLELCDKVHRANNMTSLIAQVVGHTPVTLPNYDYCDSALYAIDMKNSKWKGGAGTLPAALIMLREEKAFGVIESHVKVPGMRAVANAVENGAVTMPAASPTAPDFRWSARLIVPQKALAQSQERVGGWTSVSFWGYLLWVAGLLAVFEAVRLVYRKLKREGKVPQPLRHRVDSVSSLCDVFASYMPCSGAMYTRGVRVRSNSVEGGGEPSVEDGTYHAINGTDGQRLMTTKSAPF